MDPGSRIRICLLIEEMERNRELAKQLQLKNASTFEGIPITSGQIEEEKPNI